MSNGLGGDSSSFELAAEAYWKGEAQRLQKELDRLNRKLRGDANGHEKHSLVETETGADVQPVPVTWQWNGYLAAGKFHILAGSKGTLKTSIAIDLAARITVGGKWPDGTQAPLGDVLIWSGEDDFDDTLLPRLLAAGGNGKRFHHVKGIFENGRRRPFDPARDVEALLEVSRGIPELRMMIVDSIVSAVAGDSHKNAETRRGLQPLVGFGAERKCSVLGLTHFSKGTTGRDPVERVTGSLAFAAQARIVLVTAKPIAADGKRRLVRAASNIGPDGGGVEYAAIQEPLTGYDFAAQRVMWEGQLEGSARDLLNDVEQENDKDPAPQRSAAARFLSGLLAKGPVPVAQIRKDADDAGLSWATIRRAYNELRITTEKDGYAVGWSWRLPQEVPPGGHVDL